MMQAFLMNFGSNTRVVNDSQNVPQSIGIGKIVECDIHDVHFHMIRRAVATETLMVVPKEVRVSDRLAGIMTLLRDLETEPYDDLLNKFFELLPPPGLEERQYRPTREQIRMALMEASRREVAAALKLQSKVMIHEQGDEVTRKEVPRPPKVETPPPASPPKVVEPPKPTAPKRARSSAKGKQKPPSQSSKPKVKRERL